MTDIVRITVEVDVDQHGVTETPEAAALDIVFRDNVIETDPGVRVLDVELLA